jgi:hypothetical protein
MTSVQYILEMQRDWGRTETYEMTTGIAKRPPLRPSPRRMWWKGSRLSGKGASPASADQAAVASPQSPAISASDSPASRSTSAVCCPIRTGIDLDKLIEVGRMAEEIVGHVLPSELIHAGSLDAFRRRAAWGEGIAAFAPP